MQLFVRFASIAGLLAVCTTAVQAELRSSVRDASYTVDGESLSAVWQEISYKAPQVLRNGSWQAETRIRYRWDVQYVAVGTGCVAKRPMVDVAVTIVLPEWRAARLAAPATQAAWQLYRERLREHEEQHRNIALETANALDSLLRNAPRSLSCDGLSARLDAAADRILAEERRRQNHYDRFAAPIRLY